MIATVFLGLLAAQAALTPARRENREPLCIFDVMMADGSVSGPGALQAAKDICRARHGWSEAQMTHGVRIALYSTRMLRAANQLRSAGIDMEAVQSLFRSFSIEDRDLLGREEMGGQANRLGRLIATRANEAGIRADSEALVSVLVYMAGLDRESRLLLARE